MHAWLKSQPQLVVLLISAMCLCSFQIFHACPCESALWLSLFVVIGLYAVSYTYGWCFCQGPAHMHVLCRLDKAGGRDLLHLPNFAGPLLDSLCSFTTKWICGIWVHFRLRSSLAFWCPSLCIDITEWIGRHQSRTLWYPLCIATIQKKKQVVYAYIRQLHNNE